MTLREAIEKARRAQQLYDMRNDVQLRMELDEGVHDQAAEGEGEEQEAGKEQDR